MTERKPFDETKKNIGLLLTGYVQVLFVAMNTYFIAKSYFIGVFICGVAISLVWSWNVKKIAFGTLKDRMFYSFGAGLGSLTGAYFSYLLIN